MSRAATNEYIGGKRRAYAKASPVKRLSILAEAMETTGYERKYANKLLTGNRKFRERKGRGRTYDPRLKGIIEDIWINVGRPCTTYFMARKAEWIREYREAKGLIRDEDAAAILRTSASTTDRMFRGVPRRKLGSVRGNRRSGCNNELLAAIECRSGEETMACGVAPGDVQIDTVAPCGGDMSDNFWCILTGTDRKTQ